MLVRIRSVECVNDFVVRLTFTDETSGNVDLARFMTGRMFQALRDDPALFRQVYVDTESGTIAWPNGADLDPDVLHALATVGTVVPKWVGGGTEAA